MKRAMLFVFIICLFISIPISVTAAGSTMLKGADISVDSSSSTEYTIHENVTLTNIESSMDGTISHTFSNLKNNEISNLEVTSDGQTLIYEWDKGETLNKLNVEVPKEAAGDFTYSLQYNLVLKPNSFTTQLFVPMYPAAGTNNVVHLEFSAPEGEVIQKNSFPVLTKEVGNEVENDMMNIPSHVKYVYGETSNPLNAFNLISRGVIAALIAIIVLWFRAELIKKKEVAA